MNSPAKLFAEAGCLGALPNLTVELLKAFISQAGCPQ
jgi:hypothetical protein